MNILYWIGVIFLIFGGIGWLIPMFGMEIEKAKIIFIMEAISAIIGIFLICSY